MGDADEVAMRIEQAAAMVEGLDRRADADGIGYSLEGVLFAVVGNGHASFRLRPDVADAALKTPDVRAGARPGWVELRAPHPDQFALDRASSWFASAARFAAESPQRRMH